jgi:hypothetical protein
MVRPREGALNGIRQGREGLEVDIKAVPHRTEATVRTHVSLTTINFTPCRGFTMLAFAIRHGPAEGSAGRATGKEKLYIFVSRLELDGASGFGRFEELGVEIGPIGGTSWMSELGEGEEV